MGIRIAVIMVCVVGLLICRAGGQAVTGKGTLSEFVEPPALAKASADEKAMWTQVRKGLLAEAA